MNVENENSEPVADLGLALGYSSQCTQRKLSNDSGAGANAGFRVDMKFVTSDSLSELVWTPQNGLSMKCTDCSFTDKKSSLFWYAGPNNTVLSPSQNIKDNFIVSQGAFYVKSEMGNQGTSIRTPESDATAKAVFGLGCEDTADKVAVDFLQNEPSSENPTGGGRDAGQENQAARMMLASPGRGHDGSAPFLRKESKSKMTITIGVHPLERQESTSENDIQTLITENVYGAEKKKIVASESAHALYVARHRMRR